MPNTEPTLTPAPDQEPEESVSKMPTSKMTALVATALIFIIAVSAFLFGRVLRFTQPAQTPGANSTLVQAPPEKIDEVPAANSNQATTENVNAATPDESTWYSGWYRGKLEDVRLRQTTYPSGLVAWQTPAIEPKLGVFHSSHTLDNGQPVYDQGEPAYLRIGTFTGGKYSGKNIYLTDVPCDGPCGIFVRFVMDGGNVVILTKYSDPTPDGSIEPMVESTGKFKVVRDDMDIPEMDFPNTLTVSKPSAKLERAQNMYGFDGFLPYDAAKKPLFTDTNLGPAFASDNGAVAFQAPDGTTRYYRLIPSFVGADTVPHITWTDGAKNTESYFYQTLSGCGFSNYGYIVTDLADADLVITGHLASGEAVYVLKNADDKRYHDAYGAYYAPDNKMPFAAFVAARPIFFWHDPFGRLMEFIDTKFQPQAECGKPVIYLYPPQRESVNVRVEPTGGLSKSDPAYGAGWNVIADPDGNLTEKSSGKPYPYLFWEGRSDNLWTMPTRGFSVAQADVSSFLDKKLAKLGLNAKEAADFKEFWLPRFQGHLYYFVTFSGNSLMDRIAPLTVSPKPDTVIRILMDFKGTDAPLAAIEPTMRTPERKGFTVIEWGGVIR